MNKVSKRMLRLILNVFLFLILLWFFLKIYVTFFVEPKTYHDIPGWKLQMTEEQMIEHVSSESSQMVKSLIEKASKLKVCENDISLEIAGIAFVSDRKSIEITNSDDEIITGYISEANKNPRYNCQINNLKNVKSIRIGTMWLIADDNKETSYNRALNIVEFAKKRNLEGHEEIKSDHFSLFRMTGSAVFTFSSPAISTNNKEPASFICSVYRGVGDEATGQCEVVYEIKDNVYIRYVFASHGEEEQQFLEKDREYRQTLSSLTGQSW